MFVWKFQFDIPNLRKLSQNRRHLMTSSNNVQLRFKRRLRLYIGFSIENFIGFLNIAFTQMMFWNFYPNKPYPNKFPFIELCISYLKPRTLEMHVVYWKMKYKFNTNNITSNKMEYNYNQISLIE